MPTVEQAFNWLLSLPPGALYGFALAFAFAENILPPLPSDVLIGLCALIAAAGGTPPQGMFALVIVGTVAGAAVMYGLGRKYGAQGVHARLEQRGWVKSEQKIEAYYERWGLGALFLGRLIPGVRAVVPMVAGAFRINAFPALLVIAGASMIWYGVLIWLAARVGANWQLFADQLKVFSWWGSGVAVVLAVIGVVVGWLMFKRRRA